MLPSNDPAQKIELYLRQVRSGLRNLPEPQVADILQELRSHILERAQSGGTLSDATRSMVDRCRLSSASIAALTCSGESPRPSATARTKF